MNAKKCKMIRQAIKANGANPKDVSYNNKLPYVSSWFVTVKDPLTGADRQVKQTAAPLKMDPCGRRIYKSVKQDFSKIGQYRVKG